MHDDDEYAPPDTEHLAQVAAWAIAHCEFCDDEGMRGIFVCDHVDYAAAAKRGIAKVRAELDKARKP